MRIDQQNVFLFTFDTGEMGHVQIPVTAEDRPAAADKLQNIFSKMQTELAMEFPKIAVPSMAIENALPPIPTGGLGDILIERIGTLMDSLGGAALTEEGKAVTIKNWTDLEYIPANYSKIVTDLELIQSGKKDIPVKAKKK